MTRGQEIRVLTVPLTPLSTDPNAIGERLRPATSLDAVGVREQIKSGVVTEVQIGSGTWTVTNVLSSYTPETHVMIIETSPGRNVPGPEYVSDDEGEKLMGYIARIVHFLVDRDPEATISVGFNWGPRSWGEREEIGGFQSVMRWHLQIWQQPDDDKSEFVKWVDPEELTDQERKLMDNPFSHAFGGFLQDKLSEKSVFTNRNIQEEVDGRGLEATFDASLTNLLGEHFFSILKPTAVLLNEIFTQLTEAMTDICCKEMDAALAAAVENPRYLNVLSQLKILRRTPNLLPLSSIVTKFEEHSLPLALLDHAYEPVYKRCRCDRDAFPVWRKGFGCAVVLTGGGRGSSCLRITPGLLTGPGGVVEAQGTLLRRPEDKWASEEAITRRRRALKDLALQLEGN